MIRKYLFLILTALPLLFSACGGPESKFIEKTDTKGNTIYIGKGGNNQVLFDHEDLFWFRNGFDDYVPNADTIKELKKWKNDIYIFAFGGTWCDDTKVLLPKFYKAMNEAEFTGNDVTLYLVDRDKTSEDGVAQAMHVEKVPTFIIFRNGRMLGRVVETTDRPIECAILNIIKSNW
jgi:thiol-disulfide isomerase/thioredoxin